MSKDLGQLTASGLDQLTADGLDILADNGDPCCCGPTPPTCALPDRTLTITGTVTIPGSCCYDACGWCSAPGCEITDCCTKEIKAVTFTVTKIIPADLLDIYTGRWQDSGTTAEQDTARICRDRSVTVIEETGFCPPTGNLVQVSLPCACGQGCCRNYKGTMTMSVDLRLECTEGVPTWSGGVTLSVDLSTSSTDTNCDGGALSPGSEGGDPTLSFTIEFTASGANPPSDPTGSAPIDGGGFLTCAGGSNPCPDITADGELTLVWS